MKGVEAMKAVLRFIINWRLRKSLRKAKISHLPQPFASFSY
jgi:hypothetical protein